MKQTASTAAQHRRYGATADVLVG